jgi:2-polyprenyl-3-methyl-5-hydroxy-6-metoxy-1,4-benzoquinol methylase
MPTPAVTTFVRASLPPPPARILEVGAGDGALAATLAQAGYDVVAIDPAAQAANVVPVALLELREDGGSFDAAVAVLSLHHVRPLEASCRRLGALVRPGGLLVVDEFDVERLDEAAAGWWLEQRAALGRGHAHEAAHMVAEMRKELHPLRRLHDELSRFFALGMPVRGAYLHRWDLDPALRGAEEELIAAGRLPALGVRLVGTRREGPR